MFDGFTHNRIRTSRAGVAVGLDHGTIRKNPGPPEGGAENRTLRWLDPPALSTSVNISNSWGSNDTFVDRNIGCRLFIVVSD